MKKIFCILSILAFVSPALAAVVPGDPGATVAITSDNKAANAPGYGLKNAGDNDAEYSVTAGYVKGAYNATIKAVNMVASQKQNTLTSASGGNVTTSGTGAIVSNVSASNGTVTITKREVTIPIGSQPTGTVDSGRAPLWIE